MIDHSDTDARTAPALHHDPIDSTENADPIEPTDANDPTLPIDRNDPVLHIESIDPRDRILRIELFVMLSRIVVFRTVVFRIVVFRIVAPCDRFSVGLHPAVYGLGEWRSGR
jgi:hypothetical protein